MQVMNDEVPERESLKQTLKQTHLTKANLLKFLLSLAYGVSWLFAVSYPEIRGNRTLEWSVAIGGMVLYRPYLWLVTYLAMKYFR